MLYIIDKVNQASQRILAKFSITAKLSVYDFGKSSLPLVLDCQVANKEFKLVVILQGGTKRSGPNDDGGGDDEDELCLRYAWPRKGVQPYFQLEP